MNDLMQALNINADIYELVDACEKELHEEYEKHDKVCEYYSTKILAAFHKYKVSETHFYGSSGYGYGDVGREVIEQVYSEVLGAQDSLVRNQFISGTHALSVTLSALLRPNDTLLSITGTPYDTLHEVIGIKDNSSSLISYGIIYKEIALLNDDFDYEKIIKTIKNNKIKVISIQRSKGYSTRKSINIEKLDKIINIIKEIDLNIIIMVDNCYTELVEEKTPLEVGADLIVGSLIKNLGAGIASNGAYVCGKKDLIHLVSERLNVPGEAKDVGPTGIMNKEFLKGLFMAPEVVNNSVKIAILTSKVMEKLNYKVDPVYNEQRVDIVQNIYFNNKKELIEYVKGIQNGSAIDAYVDLVPTQMPGYYDDIIMASGSFTQGSSIEMSCDAPIREPYIAYQQGSITYYSGKLALMIALTRINNYCNFGGKC